MSNISGLPIIEFRTNTRLYSKTRALSQNILYSWLWTSVDAVYITEPWLYKAIVHAQCMETRFWICVHISSSAQRCYKFVFIQKSVAKF